MWCDLLVPTTLRLLDDPAGALNLVRWVEALRAVADKTVTAAAGEAAVASMSVHRQRLVHPGVVPVSGDGLVAAQPLQALRSAGRTPESISLLHWLDSVSGLDPDRLEQQNTLLGSLLTLVTDRKCEVVSELVLTAAENPDRAHLLPLSSTIDSILGAPMPAWPQIDRDLRIVLAQLASLEADAGATLTGAIHMHHSACLLFVSDTSAAYALAVGGLELMAMHFGSPPSKWQDWNLAVQWDKFIAGQQFSEEQASALRERLMLDRQVRLGETFANYVTNRLPSEFWNENVEQYVWAYKFDEGAEEEGTWSSSGPRDPHFGRDTIRLKRALKQTYQARSNYVHAGRKAAPPSWHYFGESSERDRSLLSFSQVRSSLRRLITLELEQLGDKSLRGLGDVGYHLQ